MAKVVLTILDQKYVMNLTNQQETLMKDVLATRYSYQVNIPNPTFNPALPVDATNTQLIANPESVGDFLAKAILNDILSGAKSRRVEEKVQVGVINVRDTAVSDVNTEFSNVTITEDVTTP